MGGQSPTEALLEEFTNEVSSLADQTMLQGKSGAYRSILHKQLSANGCRTVPLAAFQVFGQKGNLHCVRQESTKVLLIRTHGGRSQKNLILSPREQNSNSNAEHAVPIPC